MITGPELHSSIAADERLHDIFDDGLLAAEVVARLGGLTPAQLRRVREHERRNGNRRIVLAAVARRLG